MSESMSGLGSSFSFFLAFFFLFDLLPTVSNLILCRVDAVGVGAGVGVVAGVGIDISCAQERSHSALDI